MKKFIKKALLLPSLLLGACAAPITNSTDSVTSSILGSNSLPSMNESSSLSSSSKRQRSTSQSNASSSSFDQEEEERVLPNSVLNSLWGLEAATASYDALGVAIPYIECDSFEYEVLVDDFGDPAIWFYCYYKTDELAEVAYDKYVSIIETYGYSGERKVVRQVDYDTLTYFEFEAVYANRVIQEHHGIELDFLTSTHNKKPCLGIYGFTYLYEDPNIYPQIAIEDIYKEHASELPQIIGDGYRYRFMFYMNPNTNKKILEIAVENAPVTIEEDYFNALKEIGCAFSQYDELDDYYDEAVLEYEGFEDSYYYEAYNQYFDVIFDFNLSSFEFIIDIFE